jgi:hypothetical protein
VKSDSLSIKKLRTYYSAPNAIIPNYLVLLDRSALIAPTKHGLADFTGESFDPDMSDPLGRGDAWIFTSSDDSAGVLLLLVFYSILMALRELEVDNQLLGFAEFTFEVEKASGSEGEPVNIARTHSRAIVRSFAGAVEKTFPLKRFAKVAAAKQLPPIIRL